MFGIGCVRGSQLCGVDWFGWGMAVLSRVLAAMSRAGPASWRLLARAPATVTMWAMASEPAPICSRRRTWAKPRPLARSRGQHSGLCGGQGIRGHGTDWCGMRGAEQEACAAEVQEPGHLRAGTKQAQRTAF